MVEDLLISLALRERLLGRWDGRDNRDRPRAVRIISPLNIGLFDRIANPGGPERESGTNLVVEIKYIIFQLLTRVLQLAKQEQDEQHNQNQSTYANPGMAHAVAVTSEPAAEA